MRIHQISLRSKNNSVEIDSNTLATAESKSNYSIYSTDKLEYFLFNCKRPIDTS